MNIQIEFIGFPGIYDIFPEGSHPYSFQGESLPQLLQHLMERDDQRTAESLMDVRTRSLDRTVQIRVNGEFIEAGQIQEQKIQEGDHVTFLRLLAGG